MIWNSNFQDWTLSNKYSGPWECKINKNYPYNCLSSMFWQFLGCGNREGIQPKPTILSKLWRWGWESRENRVAKIHRIDYQTGNCYRDYPLDGDQQKTKYSPEHTAQFRWARNSGRQKENHLKRTRRNRTQDLHRVKSNVNFHHAEWKTSLSTGQSRGLRNDLHQQCGIISCRLNYALVPSNKS